MSIPALLGLPIIAIGILCFINVSLVDKPRKPFDPLKDGTDGKAR